MKNVSIALMMACGACYGAVAGSGPRMTTAELFNGHLDTSIPALRDIPTKMASGDEAGAEKIFADYVRSTLKADAITRQWREKTYSAHERAALRETVAATLDYRFEAGGAGWHHFKDRKIDWTYNPTFNGYREWTWQFNRMPFWTALAEEYVQTKDEKLVACWIDQIGSWFDQAEAPKDNNAYRPCTWRTIDAGLRMDGWSRQLHAFIRSPQLTDSFIARYFRSIWEHGHRLETASQGRGNWVIIEKHGLLRIALLYPFFRESARWRKIAQDRLLLELDEQVYPDGFQAELTTGYQKVLTDGYGAVMRLYQALDLPIPDLMRKRFASLWDIYPRLMMPDGRTPDLNDGARCNVAATMRKALSYDPSRSDWQWFGSGGRSGTPPDFCSYIFPYAGAAAFRTGWGKKDVWVYMDASPFGMGHQHEDKLNVLMQAYGKDMLTEGGCYFYDKSETRKYVISTRAHNTIRIDGKDQCSKATYRWFPDDIAKKATLRFALTSPVDMVEASYTNGYGVAGYRVEDLDRTVHTRKLFLCKNVRGLPPFAVVVDRIVATDGRVRTYETVWHLETCRLALAKNAFEADFGDDVGLVGIQSDDEATFVDMKGQKVPYFQGWMPVWKAGPHEQRPIPTPVAVGTFRNAKRLVTILWPYAKGQAVVADLKASPDVNASDFEIALRDGTRHVFDEEELSNLQ